MPELPDVVVYIESLQKRIVGEVLERVRIASPFLLRSVEPPIAEVEGKRVITEATSAVLSPRCRSTTPARVPSEANPKVLEIQTARSANGPAQSADGPTRSADGSALRGLRPGPAPPN